MNKKRNIYGGIEFSSIIPRTKKLVINLIKILELCCTHNLLNPKINKMRIFEITNYVSIEYNCNMLQINSKSRKNPYPRLDKG